MSKQNDQPIEKYDSVWSLFVRVFWALLGNVILFFTTISIFWHKGEIFHIADIIFWSTAAALVFARYLDIKFWGGLTAKGEPVSTTHWRKYTIVLLLCSTVVWAASHTINYLVINN